jgi:hypothetical protein
MDYIRQAAPQLPGLEGPNVEALPLKAVSQLLWFVKVREEWSRRAPRPTAGGGTTKGSLASVYTDCETPLRARRPFFRHDR